MQKSIDNIPHVNRTNVLSYLGKSQPSFNMVKAFEATNVFSLTNFEGMTNINFDTLIKEKKDTNTYEVLTESSEDKKETEKEDKEVEKEDNEDSDKEEDEENNDIQVVFKDSLNSAFVGTLSIVGLFILYRMIQKSR
jgi:hypothetical protein